MNKVFTLIIAAISLSQVLYAQQTGKFQKDIIFQGSLRSIHYSVPTNYNPNNTYPLIVVLHGCGQSSSQFRNDYAFLTDSIDAIVIAPQGPSSNQGFFMQQQNQMVIKIACDSAMDQYNINFNKMYLVGFSCNGLSSLAIGTVEGLYLFEGIIALAATVSPPNMLHIDLTYPKPVCMCVGENDSLALQSNRNVRDAFNANSSSQLSYTEVPNVGHVHNYSGYQTDIMNCIRFMLNPTNITNAKPIRNSEIKIYPNPSSDFLYYEASFDTSKLSEYRIYSNTGALIRSSKLKSNRINVSKLNKGIYLIHFINNNQTIGKRFNKQ